MPNAEHRRPRRNAARLRLLPPSGRPEESLEERRMLERLERAWNGAPPSAPGRAMQSVRVTSFESHEPAA